MKTAAAILSNVDGKASASALPLPTDSTRMAAPESSTSEQIAQVWHRLASIYGHKWTSQYGERVDPLWSRAMKSLPVERLKVALARCGKRDDPWPPSLPEFLAMSRIQPEEVSAPEFDRAFSEAVNQSYPYASWRPWSHRCVYWASIWTGQSDLAERGQAIRKQFDREYQKALDQHDTLSEPPVGRLAEKTQQQSEEERIAAAEQGIANLKQILSGAA